MRDMLELVPAAAAEAEDEVEEVMEAPSPSSAMADGRPVWWWWWWPPRGGGEVAAPPLEDEDEEEPGVVGVVGVVPLLLGERGIPTVTTVDGATDIADIAAADDVNPAAFPAAGAC